MSLYVTLVGKLNWKPVRQAKSEEARCEKSKAEMDVLASIVELEFSSNDKRGLTADEDSNWKSASISKRVRKQQHLLRSSAAQQKSFYHWPAGGCNFGLNYSYRKSLIGSTRCVGCMLLYWSSRSWNSGVLNNVEIPFAAKEGQRYVLCHDNQKGTWPESTSVPCNNLI